MTSQAPNVVASRLDRLERQNRFLRLLVSAIALLMCYVLVAGSGARSRPTTEEVVAQRFVLSDSEGNERALLAMSNLGQPSLSLHDYAGETVAMLEGLPDGSSRLTLSSGGIRRLDLFLWEDGSPHLAFYDESGKTRAAIGMEDDAAFLAFLDESQRVIRQLP